jgi:hypothetical protein
MLVRITNGAVLRSTLLMMASGGMIYIPSFVMIHSGIQLVLMSLHQQSDRLQRWTDL